MIESSNRELKCEGQSKLVVIDDKTIYVTAHIIRKTVKDKFLLEHKTLENG